MEVIETWKEAMPRPSDRARGHRTERGLSQEFPQLSVLTTCPFDLALDPGGAESPRFLESSHSEGSWFSGQTTTKLSPCSVRKQGGTGNCVLNCQGHFLFVTQLYFFVDGMRILAPGALRVIRESACKIALFALFSYVPSVG